MKGQSVEKPAVRCRNCDEQYNGYFCPGCGQKFLASRYTLRDSFSQITATVFNVERGFWHTAIMLLRQPAKVLHDYLNGVTVPYFSPFRFLFILLTFQVFIMLSFGISEAIEDHVIRNISGEAISGVQKQLMGVINSYIHILVTISMPVLAAGSWLFFRKSGLNYAEHLIISCFAYAETILISFLLMLLYFVDSQLYLSVNIWGSLISIAYFTYVYLSFFKGRKWMIILKAIGAYVVWFAGFVCILSIFIALYMMWLYSRHPEVLEQLKSA